MPPTYGSKVLSADGNVIAYQKRQRIERIRSQLEAERSSFKGQWRDANDFILPTKARFFASDTNRGGRRNHKIIDTTATLESRTLVSGMMAGITSPARPWLRLGLPDEGKLPGEESTWLHKATEIMLETFLAIKPL